MANDRELRKRMAIEERFKEKAGKDDTRSAYRAQLTKAMADPDRFAKRKRQAIKDGAIGVGATLLAPLDAVGRAQYDSESRKKGKKDMLESMEVGVRGALSEAGRSMRGVKNAVSAYKSASADEKAAKREAKDELKRESRGMKAGGFVRAADGCAKKGKTKGKMR